MMRRATFALLIGLTAGCQTFVGLIAGPQPIPASNGETLPLAGFTEVHLEQSNAVVGDVGTTLHLLANSKYPYAWGLLDSERGRIDAQGRLTLLAPGAVRVFVERDRVRNYMVVASRAVPHPAETIPPPVNRISGDRTWAAWLTSADDWATYWRANTPLERPLAPVPATVDFTQHALLVVPGVLHDGQAPPVVTHLTPGPDPAVHLVIPDKAPTMSLGITIEYVALYRVPRFEATPRVTITGRDPRIGPELTLFPPAGPPSPSPSPSPTPDPRHSTDPTASATPKSMPPPSVPGP
ncbi:hypothetical protein D3C72_565220 [compost metagenome]